MSHTPGPWVPTSVKGGWDGVAEERNRNIICNLSLNNPDNMYLIAASPALLAACKQALSAFEGLRQADIMRENLEPTIKSLTEAIRKAEGE